MQDTQEHLAFIQPYLDKIAQHSEHHPAAKGVTMLPMRLNKAPPVFRVFNCRKVLLRKIKFVPQSSKRVVLGLEQLYILSEFVVEHFLLLSQFMGPRNEQFSSARPTYKLLRSNDHLLDLILLL